METEWRLIYTSDKQYEIEILQGLLSENNIESYIINKQDSLYLIGNIELYVPANDVIKSKLILSENQ